MGMARLLGLVVVSLVAAVSLAGCSKEKEYIPRTSPVVVGESGWSLTPIKSVLAPPLTTYNVTVQSRSIVLGAPTIEWSNSNTCGKFTHPAPTFPARGNFSVSATATWDHGDDTTCGHETTHHDGTVSVKATRFNDFSPYLLYRNSETITCMFTEGSASGTGTACTMSKTEYFEQEKAPGLEVAALLIVLGGLVLLVRRRSR